MSRPVVHVVRRVVLEQPPTALRMATASVTALGSSGVAVLRLVTPAAPHAQGQPGAVGQPGTTGADTLPPAFKPCTGLNGSSLVAAAIDMQRPDRAFALASDGSVLALAVGSERSAGAAPCSVKSAGRLPAGLEVGATRGGAAAQQPAVALSAIPGYLLLVMGDQLLVYNTTASPRSPPQLVLQQALAPLRQQFLGRGGAAAAAPLLAASKQGRHVALMLDSTALALYATALPHRSPAPPRTAALAWMQVRWAACGGAVPLPAAPHPRRTPACSLAPSSCPPTRRCCSRWA